jgi:putative ABC transport system substrate-binding protein
MNTKVLWLLTVLLFLYLHSAHAQQAKKIARIGYLVPDAQTYSERTEAFRDGLRDLGYREGQNIMVEYRDAENRLERLPMLAAELVSLKVDVIVTGGGPPTRAAKNATSSIPIVMINISDPVALGFVASFAKPGGNITGLSGIQAVLGGKRLELLKEVAPRLSRVAVFANSEVPGYSVQMKEVQLAAQALDLQLRTVELRELKDLEEAFTAVINGRAGAITMLQNPTALQAQVAKLALQRRLPTIANSARFPEFGGLMSYGSSSDQQYHRAAFYIDKILQGVKPGELPVEQITKIQLIVNLKTAKQIGLTIPPNVLARADKVIK